MSIFLRVQQKKYRINNTFKAPDCVMHYRSFYNFDLIEIMPEIKL